MKSFTALLLPLAVLVLPAVSLASEAELDWDQERVAALARDLSEPLEALRADLESHPVPENEAARAAVMTDVERLQSSAKELAQRLASGAGRAETVALFREVETLQSEAVKHSKEYPAPFDMHVYVDRVQRITIQLARYYRESSDSGDGLDRSELEWNQDRVAALAQDLLVPLVALRANFESYPSVPGKGAARAAVMNDVEGLQSSARELTQRLARGAGQAETIALFREVEALQSQAAKHSKQYPAPFDMDAYIDRIQRITTQLGRYYGKSSDSADASRR